MNDDNPHELLDRIRKMGPTEEGREYVRGLLSLLKNRPNLRRKFSARDLAFLQSLSTFDEVHYADIFSLDAEP